MTIAFKKTIKNCYWRICTAVQRVDWWLENEELLKRVESSINRIFWKEEDTNNNIKFIER